MKRKKYINRYFPFLFIFFANIIQLNFLNYIRDKSLEYKKTSISLLLCITGSIIYIKRKTIKEGIVPFSLLLATNTLINYLIFTKNKKEEIEKKPDKSVYLASKNENHLNNLNESIKILFDNHSHSINWISLNNFHNLIWADKNTLRTQRYDNLTSDILPSHLQKFFKYPYIISCLYLKSFIEKKIDNINATINDLTQKQLLEEYFPDITITNNFMKTCETQELMTDTISNLFSSCK